MKEFLTYLVAVTIMGFLIGTTFSYCSEPYTNIEDRHVNQCQQTADRTERFTCMRYSVYSEPLSTCSCVLDGTNDRITFPLSSENE